MSFRRHAHIPTPGTYCRVLSVPERVGRAVEIGNIVYVREKPPIPGLVIIETGDHWVFYWAARALLVI